MRRIQVEVAVVHRDAVHTRALALTRPACVADALATLGESVPDGARVSIWGRPVALDAPLREGDRVEVCAPLLRRPREARRARTNSAVNFRKTARSD